MIIDYTVAVVTSGGEKNEYISVILADKGDTGAFTHYVSTASLDGNKYGESGTVKVRIPEDVDMSTKTLYVINEQKNGDYKTDFSSGLNPVSCDEVEAALSGVEGENGWYKSSVTITAPTDYQIRKKADNIYGNLISYDTEQQGTVTYYLKRN